MIKYDEQGVDEDEVENSLPAQERPVLAIVVPCFNEEDALQITLEKLLLVMENLHSEGASKASYICFVDDGSADSTWEIIRSSAEKYSKDLVRGVRLSRNCGHQNAVFAGLSECVADAVVTIDADLQDDPDAIVNMFNRFLGGADVVYGVRNRRDSDTWFKRESARSFYKILQLLGCDIVSDHADFRLLSRRAVRALKEYRETNLFIRGIIPQLGYSQEIVEYERRPREQGETKYPLKSMIALAINGITSLSPTPLRAVAGLGVIVFLATLVASLWAIWAKFYGESPVPGWASSVLPMYLLGGIQIFAIGVVGEYISKIYLESKARPKYLIWETAGFSTESEL